MKPVFTQSVRLLLLLLFAFAGPYQVKAQYVIANTIETGSYPVALTKDAAGNVFAVRWNGTSYEVARYINGVGPGTSIYSGLTSTAIEYPWGLAVNAAGDVFVTDLDVSGWRIIKLSAPSYTTTTTVQTGRYFTALAVDQDNNLLAMEYISDATKRYRLMKYPAGAEHTAGVVVYDGVPYPTGAVTYPWGLATDANNNIYFLNLHENSGGQLIKLTAPAYGMTVISSNQSATALAIDNNNNVYTVEGTSPTTAHLMKYTAPVTAGASGTEVFGGLMNDAAGFFYNWGLVVVNEGRIFVNEGTYDNTGTPADENGRIIRLGLPSVTVSSVVRAASTPTNATTVAFTVTFSGTVGNVTTSAFSLTTTGVTGASIASVTGSGTTYTVTANTGAGSGTLRLNVTGTGITNSVTNAPYTSGEVYDIDKTAPVISTFNINSNATVTNSTAATLTIAATDADATLQMSFSTDGTIYSTPETYATTKSYTLPAGDGAKTVYIRVTDRAGNVASAQDDITLDQTAPNTTITAGPPDPTNNGTATFTFISDEIGTFEGSLDGGGFTFVTSPHTFTGLTEGSHTFEVRAVDVAGNVDPVPASYTWTIDLTAPTVSSVSVPANAYYQTSQDLDFTVNYSEAVTVNTAGGIPSLPVTIGASTVNAVYVSGSGASALVFRYTVQAADQDLNGIVVGSTIALNGGTMADAAGNNAGLALSNIGNTTGVLVYSVVPAVTLSSAAPADVNAPFTVTATFSEAVSGFTVGGITVTNATASNLQTTDNITYTLTVTPAAGGAVTIQVSAGAAVNIASNGNTASNTLNFTYDADAPVVTSVSVPADGYYKTGDHLDFTVNYNENVNVNATGGTPYIDLTIGGSNVQAAYQGGTGTGALVFRYTVQAGDEDMDGVALGAGIVPNGGTLADVAGNNAVLVLTGVAGTTNVRVHTAIPSVTLTTAAPALVNAPFTVTATFSEAITGITLGGLTLTNATASNLQTADNITYTFTVTPTADGAVSVVASANAGLNIAGTGNTVSNTLNFTYDGTAPVTVAVAVPADAYYKEGNTLSFTVTFSENVNVTGSPSLSVVIGGATRDAVYVSGSGTSQLTFSYTVQAGEMDLDGIVINSSLLLNSGTIRDAATNNAVLTLNGVPPTTGIFVNTTSPTVVLSATATSPVNAPFTATVTFSEAVTGFATGDITTTNATLSNLQTTDNITYTVLVTPAADGVVTLVVPADAAVNIGNNGNTASNTLSYTYDGTAPVVTSVSVPANGYYKTGDVLSFTVNFSENVTGTPSLGVVIGSTTVQAGYVSGTGSNALVFSYTVQNGETDLNGIAVGTLTGTLNDAAGNAAVNTLNNVGITTGVLVYTATPGVQLSGAPSLNGPFTLTVTFTEAVTGFAVADITATNATVSNLQTTDNITYTVLVTPTADGAVSIQVPANVAVNVISNGNTASNTITYTFDGTAPVTTSVDVPANGYYKAGDNLDFSVHFSEVVNVAGAAPAIPLTVGSAAVEAVYVSGTGTNTLLFRYTVLDGDMDNDGIAPAAALELNSSTITDVSGNNAVLTLNGVANTSNVRVNTAHPSVAVSTAVGTNVNAAFTVTFTFSEAVTGFAATDITVANGAASNLQTTDNITYTATITPAADGAVSVSVPADVAVNIGNNGNTASNTISTTYDATAPVTTIVTVPANGYYKDGNTLSFTVTFSENVNVTGSPSLSVVIGATTRDAVYVSGSGTSQLTFSYTVQAGEMDLDGIVINSSLLLNSGTIRDAATNNAVLTLNGVPPATGIFVNTTSPTVVLSATATSPVNAPFTATVTFSEAVTGFATGDITTTNATLSNLQTTDNIAYTVLVTPAADGVVTLVVPADAAVNIGNNGNTASNTLSYTYDGTAPVVTSVSVPANGYYKTGDVLSFTVNFSENVTGTPSLGVVIGSTTVQAGYVSGTGSNALVFSYTVQNGETDLNGIAVGTLTGTLNDAAGNAAVNTLNNVGITTGVLVYTATPGVQLSGTPSLNGPFTLTVTFTEAVTGFAVADITATNATVSNLQTTDNITYTVLVTPTADGAVSLQVPANVAVNVISNGNTASNTITYTFDGTAPVTTSVDVPANGYYKAGDNLNFSVHFSEVVNVAGGTPSVPVTVGSTVVQAAYVSGTGTNTLLFRYTVAAGDMDNDGIAPGAALALNGSTIRDASGNDAVLTLNGVANTGNVRVNTARASVTITTTAAARVNTAFTATFTFSEAVTGFAATDITVVNGAASNLQTTDNITYTATITPAADGTVTVHVPADVAVNVGNNGNAASNTLSIVYDATAPVINAAAFEVLDNVTAGTAVGTLTAAETAGTLQNWTITADGSGGAFALNAATGVITVNDAAILAGLAGTTVTLSATVNDGLNTSTASAITIKVVVTFVNKAPLLNAISNAAVCTGTAVQTIQLTGASAAEADQAYTITATSSQPLFDVLSVNASNVLSYQLKSSVTTGTAVITVTIRDNGGTANGGVDSLQRSFTITVNGLPTVSITSDKGTSISKGDIVHLAATAGTGYIYQWSPADGVLSGQQSVTLEARPQSDITYQVTVTNAAGCSSTASISLAVVEDFKVDATNILTPNGDGRNDKWVIRNLDSYPNNEVMIYDRSGRMIYRKVNYTNDWEGTVNGNALAEGTYFYVLKINGGAKTAKGFITIIRDQH